MEATNRFPVITLLVVALRNPQSTYLCIYRCRQHTFGSRVPTRSQLASRDSLASCFQQGAVLAVRAAVSFFHRWERDLDPAASSQVSRG
jgi:hypothetical protein